MATTSITHLERRKIEAGVLIPLLQAFQAAIGKDQANAIARDVVVGLARKDGEHWADEFGRDLPAMQRVSAVWAGGGSLEIRPLRATEKALNFDVTRCRYAEFYKELGLAELGLLFHCSRDFAMVEGFSRELKLQRTQTLMEGASHCDFRFTQQHSPK